MQAVLNFSKEEKKTVAAFLAKHAEEKTNSTFEEKRAKIGESTATLYKSGKLLIQGKDCEQVKEKILSALEGKTKDELILGIDETGRGENFGPLVVAGVLGTTNSLRELRDSKKTKNISEKKELVEKNALAKSWIEIGAKQIDEMRNEGINLNMIEAKAMNELIEHFRKNHGARKFKIVIDGNKIDGVSGKVEFMPKADDLVVQVGAASVLAKYVRDNSADKEKRKSWKTKA